MSVMVKGANLLDSFIVGWHMLVRSLLLQARTFISPTWKHKFLHVVCLTCLLPSSLQRADVCIQRLRRLFCCGLNCLLSRATPLIAGPPQHAWELQHWQPTRLTLDLSSGF